MRLLVAIQCLLLASGALAEDQPLLRKVEDIPLPGSATRFDYASLDSTTGLLYLNHMGAGEVMVFDVRARKVVAVLKGFERCTGIRAVPELGRVFVSAAGTDEVVAIDRKTNHVLKRLPTAGFPDGIAFEPATQRIFVSEESGKAVTVIDAVGLAVIGRIALGGEAGNTQVDSAAHLVYTNNQTNGELVVIDPSKLTVKARIPVGLKGNHGLCLHPTRHLAFIASEEVDSLVVLDLDQREVVGRFPVGGGPDVLAFDPDAGQLYVACESGVVSVFRMSEAGLVKRGDQAVGSNSHVVAVDTATHLIYLPLKDVGGRPVLRIMEPLP